MSSISLRPTSIDFDSTMQDLYTLLASSEAWRGNIDSQTGNALLSFVSTVNVFAQQKILRALQEAFPDTAVSDRSHYALASLQGVRIRRKSPASCTVTLSSTEAISIPPYTQFSSSGVSLFNRDALFIHPSTPVTTTLYEGAVKNVEITGLGSDYQMYVPFDLDFVVADSDVVVKIGGVQLQRTTLGLWELPRTPGFEDRTLPDGRLSIVFGTVAYGSRPGPDETVAVTYVITTGSQANAYGLVDEGVATELSSAVSGIVTTALSNGEDQLSAFQYKNIASQTFGTFSSAVTKRQYHTVALQFPGIVDVVMFSQREIDPTDVTKMNLVKVVVLTSPTWKAGDNERFLEYLNANTMYSTRFYLESPVASPTDVQARVYCYNWANLSEVKQAAESAITYLFQPRSGFINYDIYKSDLSVALRDAHPGIEYFELVNPTEDCVISAKPVSNLSGYSSAGTGSLAAGIYYYGVGVELSTASGTAYIKPQKVVTVVADDAASTSVISWSAVPNATSYFVYGRDGTGMYLLATLPATSLSFSDDGSLPPGAPAPNVDSHPVQYLTLNTLNITAAYSNRQRV